MAIAEDRRSALIQSAVHLFAREGIDAANTGAVARNAGVAAGTLFNYFRSKTDLIHSAYLYCKAEAAGVMRASIRPESGTQENLQRIWESAIVWHLENGDATDFMEQFRNSPAAKEEDVAQKTQQEFSFLCELVERALNKGELANLPMDFLDDVFSALFLATVSYMRERELPPGDPFQTRSFELLWRAISGPA